MGVIIRILISYKIHGENAELIFNIKFSVFIINQKIIIFDQKQCPY